MFINSQYASYKENADFNNYMNYKEQKLSSSEKSNMRGYVFTIHETKDGKREILDFDHNHIVLCGRKWLMQRAIGSSMSDTPNQHNYTINWFGIGKGGANSSDILLPLYTPDQQQELVAPIKIYKAYQEGYTYSNDGYKKTFQKFDNRNAQMKEDIINSEILALFHLVLDFNDCPYDAPNLGVNINELALYASPSQNPTENEFVMFSRYCMATKFKSHYDRYTFLWYIYF